MVVGVLLVLVEKSVGWMGLSGWNTVVGNGAVRVVPLDVRVNQERLSVHGGRVRRLSAEMVRREGEDPG